MRNEPGQRKGKEIILNKAAETVSDVETSANDENEPTLMLKHLVTMEMNLHL